MKIKPQEFSFFFETWSLKELQNPDFGEMNVRKNIET
jgi:hypothetical protein